MSVIRHQHTSTLPFVGQGGNMPQHLPYFNHGMATCHGLFNNQEQGAQPTGRRQIRGHIRPKVITMKTVLQGEKGRRETIVGKESVTVHHVTQNGFGDDAVNYQLCWLFDFSEVTREELMELAAKHLTINVSPGRAAFKKTKNPKADDWDNRTYLVREWLDSERKQRVSKTEKAKRLLSQMTEEEKQELLDSLK